MFSELKIQVSKLKWVIDGPASLERLREIKAADERICTSGYSTGRFAPETPAVRRRQQADHTICNFGRSKLSRCMPFAVASGIHRKASYRSRGGGRDPVLVRTAARFWGDRRRRVRQSSR